MTKIYIPIYDYRSVNPDESVPSSGSDIKKTLQTYYQDGKMFFICLKQEKLIAENYDYRVGSVT